MYFYNPDKFREIDHTADVGLRAEGNSLSDLFANLAFGMLFIAAGEIEKAGDLPLHIEVQEKSEPDLIVSWLSEINYHLNVHHFLPSVIYKISIHRQKDSINLKSDLCGFNIIEDKIELKTEIKAVTYHQLILEKRENGFMGQVIFDI